MATLDWELATAGDVTLVHVAVSADVRRTVRIENDLAGPAWPPRSQGTPLAGWDENGFTGPVGPDDPLILGFATPAPPAEPPVTLVEDPPDPGATDGPSPAALVRALGRAGPPRAAVPQIGAARTAAGETSDPGTRGVQGSDGDTPGGAGGVHRGRQPVDGGSSPVPAGVDAWLSAVEERVAAADSRRERVGDAAGAAGGGPTRLRADRRAISAVGERVAALSARLDHVGVGSTGGAGHG